MQRPRELLQRVGGAAAWRANFAAGKIVDADPDHARYSAAGSAASRRPSVPIAHARHTHDLPRSSAGIFASTAASIVTSKHQHRESKVALRAGAHAFGPPQIGQVGLGFGFIGGGLPRSLT